MNSNTLGCNHNFVGKAERSLFERSCDKNSVVLNHIVNCNQVNFIKSIFSIPTKNAIHPKIDKKSIYNFAYTPNINIRETRTNNIKCVLFCSYSWLGNESVVTSTAFLL